MVDDFESGTNKVQNIGLSLDGNSFGYSSMQAKIHVPAEMEIERVYLGEGASNHTLNYNLTEDGTLHVVIYSLDSTPFASGFESLLRIEARAEELCGDLTVDRIIFANTYVEEYTLAYSGGRNAGTPTGIDNAADGSVKIEKDGKAIVVYNAEGLNITIWTVAGETAAARKAQGNIEKFELADGIYVVNAGNVTAKIKL